ncbi:MAG TPA: hypothetical protein VHQ23_00840 [Ilumatobacteraceae bacterium]|nr:hypothetical protein [Ilumatobacteraceae bacterium]
MFTTGSKLFLGATALSIAAAVIWGNAKVGAEGWLGVLGLLSAALAFGLIFGVNWYTKDGNVSAMSENAITEAPAARPPAERSMWPALAAIGVGTVAVGAVSKPIVFKAGIILLLAAAVEWVVSSWSERASADASYNLSLRKRLLHPIEFPVLAAVGLAVLIYSFSRVMLWIDKSAGPAVFVVTGALILFGGFVFASKPSLQKGVVTGICTIAALGIISAGAVAALDGQRPITEHPTTETDNSAACNSAEEGPGELAEIDGKGSQAVASKASVGLIVTLEDGQLIAHQQGIEQPQNPVTVSRGNTVNMIFKNRDDDQRRLTVNMGEFEEDVNGTAVKTRPQVCTTLVKPGGDQFLTFELAKPSIASNEPYTFTVPGLDDLTPVEIKVP